METVGTATGVVNLTVIPVNDDPVITTTPVTTPEDTAVTGNATATDVDGDVLTFFQRAVNRLMERLMLIQTEHTRTFLHKIITVPIVFTISVSDGNGGMATATVTVTVYSGE